MVWSIFGVRFGKNTLTFTNSRAYYAHNRIPNQYGVEGRLRNILNDKKTPPVFFSFLWNGTKYSTYTCCLCL